MEKIREVRFDLCICRLDSESKSLMQRDVIDRNLSECHGLQQKLLFFLS